MTSFVLCTIPKYNVEGPLYGICLLKSVLEQNGHTARVFDLNLDLFVNLKEALPDKQWSDLEVDFTEMESFERLYESHLKSIVEKWVDDIVKLKPDYVGLTAFSKRSDFLLERMCKLLKEHDCKIIVGGPNTENIAPKLFRENNIDYYIYGEAEDTILNIANGNFSYVGINGKSPPTELDDNPFPDYSDIDLNLYRHANKQTNFLLNGSRGCILDCSFCDVRYRWGTYRYRNPKLISDEIQMLSTKYGAKRFMFTDSLINGNMKNFEHLMNELIDLRKLDVDFFWDAMVIVRTRKQMSAKHYDLLKEAGCRSIKTGVESVSSNVKAHMKKEYKLEDLDYMIKQCDRVGVQINLLFILGYLNETVDDFQENLDFLKKYSEYAKNGTIRNVTGSKLEIKNGSYLANENDLQWDENKNWLIDGNDIVVRTNRYMEFRAALKDYGYGMVAWKDKEKVAVMTALPNDGMNSISTMKK